jgi:putative membrane protein
LLLTAEERRRIDRCVADFEARTGAQAVAAFVDKSDDYPEIPWKAFALGVSFASLALLAVDLWRPDWPGSARGLIFSTVALSAGGAFALLTLRSRAIARWFLNPARAEAEALQRAQVLFLEHELFRTGRRNALLLLIARFERRIVLLPDRELAARLPADGLHSVIRSVASALREDRWCDGLCDGLDAARDLLVASGIATAAQGENELADAVIEESSGARS